MDTKIKLSSGTYVEDCEQFIEWKDAHNVTIDNKHPSLDDLLLIWYSFIGKGFIEPPVGPMPGFLESKVESIENSNGIYWNVIITGVGTIDAHTSIASWNYGYKENNQDIKRIIIKLK